jgi:hypothetical protein
MIRYLLPSRWQGFGGDLSSDELEDLLLSGRQNYRVHGIPLAIIRFAIILRVSRAIQVQGHASRTAIARISVFAWRRFLCCIELPPEHADVVDESNVEDDLRDPKPGLH